MKLIVGARDDDDGAINAGAVYVLVLSSAGVVASASTISNSDGNLPFTLSASDHFGISVAPVGDLNADGTQDIAVGAYGDDDGGLSTGSLYLLILNDDGTVASGFKLSNSDGNLPFTLDDSDSFGRAVASVGDLNGDGAVDFVVPAISDDDGAIGAGAVYVVFLQPSCPSPVPSPMPTILPTPAPSQIPTPAPTPTTDFTIAPETTSLSSTKPQSASGGAYLFNLNSEPMRAAVHLLASSLPRSRERVSIVPQRLSIEPGKYEEFVVTIDPNEVVPGDYNMTLSVSATTANSLPINHTMFVMLAVGATADPNTTMVAVEGAPTLDVPWRAVEIRPPDGDGSPLTTFQEADKFVLSLKSGERTASCNVIWFTSLYTGECFVPVTSLAGDWGLAVTLSEETFYPTTVHVKCAEGDYEEHDGTCVACPFGTAVCPAGTTLETLPLKPGYWRPGAW